MTTEIGTLVVVVLKARNLIDKHSFFKQDVYTKVTLNGVTKQTRVEVKGGQHPEWDDELRFSVTESTKKAKMLEVACWSKEPRTDDLVGKGEIDITETLKTGEFDDWVPLTTSSGSQRGEVYLEMTYFATGPAPPLARRPSKLDPATRLSRHSPSDISSTPYLHQGLQDVLAFNGSHLAPPSSESPLPPVPEETSPSPSPLTAVPTLLRPGAGRGGGRHSPQPPAAAGPQSTSPHTSPQASPRPTHQAYSSTPTPLSHSQPSLDNVPGILRAGPSHGHMPSTGDLVISQGGEANAPSMPAAQINGYASVTSEPAPYLSSNTPNPHLQPNQHAQAQPPRPISASHYTSILVPALPSTPTPAPAPPAPTYSPSPAPGPWSQSPPPISQPLPTLQPSTYSVDPIPSPHSAPGFSFPAPQLSIPSYNSPPPPPSSYLTYPPTQSTYYFYPTAGSPHPRPHSQSRPYPYNYPPPPRDPDLDAPNLFKNLRYSKPLPLPDEPAGTVTPTPRHPHPTPADLASDSSHKHKSSESEAERDKLLALAIEREEEERKRKAMEQEEADRELARKLDLELNLDAMDEQTGTEERAMSPRQPPDMPGSWYRHRVET